MGSGVHGAPVPPPARFLPPSAPVPVTAAPVLSARPLRDVAGWAVAGLVLAGVLDVAQVGASLYDFQRAEGYNVYGQRLNEGDAVLGAVSGLRFLAHSLAGIVFVVWFHRAYKNVKALGAPGLRLGTGWAVGGWFMPIANLWFPKQIANDAWRASAPGRPGNAWGGWTGEAVPRWMAWWWALWIASSVQLGFAGGFGADAPNPAAYRSAALFTAFGAALSAAAAVLAIAFVRRLTDRQERACSLARDAVLRGAMMRR
jgi:Domain of unknown function (DUF4328)